MIICVYILSLGGSTSSLIALSSGEGDYFSSLVHFSNAAPLGVLLGLSVGQGDSPSSHVHSSTVTGMLTSSPNGN